MHFGAFILFLGIRKENLRHMLIDGHGPLDSLGTKWVRKANIWPKMTKNIYFRPNLAVVGPKILILTGRSNNFVTHLHTT